MKQKMIYQTNPLKQNRSFKPSEDAKLAAHERRMYLMLLWSVKGLYFIVVNILAIELVTKILPTVYLTREDLFLQTILLIAIMTIGMYRIVKRLFHLFLEKVCFPFLKRFLFYAYTHKWVSYDEYRINTQLMTKPPKYCPRRRWHRGNL
jgi:type IV secretory pathway TrbL component